MQAQAFTEGREVGDQFERGSVGMYAVPYFTGRGVTLASPTSETRTSPVRGQGFMCEPSTFAGTS